MSLYTSKNPAGVVGLQTGLIFAALSSGVVNAHMSGLQAMRAAREDAASHQLRGQLDAAISYAEQLMDLAARQAGEIERLRAENDRLRTAARTYLKAAQRKAA